MGARAHRLTYICGLSILLLGTQSPQRQDDLNKQLVTAAADGDLAAVSELLAEGADVNADNGFGVTPLYTAADWGNLELVRLLLEHGADPDSSPPSRGRSPWGKTPLMLAAISNTDVRAPEARAEIIRLLVEKGGGRDGTPLVDLIRAGYLEAVRTIVGRGGSNPSYVNMALAAARRAERAELVELLIEAGAKEPGPLDQVRSAERLARIAGIYRSQAQEALTLEPGLEEGELMLERRGGKRVALVPVDQMLFRSRERKVFVALRGRTLPPTELVLYEGDRSERFRRMADVSIRPRPARVDFRAVDVEARAADTITTEPAIAGLGEWASFRGPNGSGIADGASPPTAWDVRESINIAWRTPIPGLGHSSPIVWGDRVFVTTAVPADETVSTFRDFSEAANSGVLAYVKEDAPHSWRVYALDKHSGDILWERAARQGLPRTARHVTASHANQTPATDGTHLLVWFGSEGIYCYDLEGNLLWARDLGTLASGRYFDPGYEWNTASSPIIHKNLVILQVDVSKFAYLLALDIATGKEVWRSERDEYPSWATPVVYEGGRHTELVTAGVRFARGHDPETGEELWRLGFHSDFTIPTPIAGRGLIYLSSAYGTVEPIYAIRPGAVGDITLADDEASSEHVAWAKRIGGSGISTPIVYRGLLYVCSRVSGVLSAYDAETGERVYRARLTRGGTYSASPVAADGRLYFSSEDGEVVVVKSGPSFERLAVNQMDESLMATPAISGNTLFLRTRHHVVAVAPPTNP